MPLMALVCIQQFTQTLKKMCQAQWKKLIRESLVLKSVTLQVDPDLHVEDLILCY